MSGVPARSLMCTAAGAMTRKNRQKHRQNDRQFAPLPPGRPAACCHGTWRSLVLSSHRGTPRALLVYGKRVVVYNIGAARTNASDSSPA